MAISARTLMRYALSPEFRYEHKLARQVLNSIPEDEFQHIQRKYQTQSPGADDPFISHANTVKYLDAKTWLSDAANRATALGLHKSKPLKLLDIGCGAGWFLVTARQLGHIVTGLDLADNLMYNDLIKLLNIDRHNHRILPKEPLPDSLGTFDLVTGFMVFFNWSGSEEGWNIQEWEYFLEDCCSHLNPGGCIRFQLNQGRHRDRYHYLTDETAEGLRKFPGATVSELKNVVVVQR